MPLDNGYLDVAPGKLANVVICLEMRTRAQMPADEPEQTDLHRLRGADAETYSGLFRRIGAPYLWSSMLSLSQAEVANMLDDPLIEAYAVRHNASDEGLLELDFRVARECELRFFGVSESLQGQGFGRWLMSRAIDIAWSRPIDRFWLHTCNFDHPGALAFYIRAGFVPFKRQIEIMDDPRLAGLLPLDAAPNIPIVK